MDVDNLHRFSVQVFSHSKSDSSGLNTRVWDTQEVQVKSESSHMVTMVSSPSHNKGFLSEHESV